MDWARDFDSNFVLKTEGILDVFQDFYKQKLEQKNRPRRKKEFLEVPIKGRPRPPFSAIFQHHKGQYQLTIFYIDYNGCMMENMRKN